MPADLISVVRFIISTRCILQIGQPTKRRNCMCEQAGVRHTHLLPCHCAQCLAWKKIARLQLHTVSLHLTHMRDSGTELKNACMRDRIHNNKKSGMEVCTLRVDSVTRVTMVQKT